MNEWYEMSCTVAWLYYLGFLSRLERVKYVSRIINSYQCDELRITRMVSDLRFKIPKTVQNTFPLTSTELLETCMDNIQ